MGECRFCWLGEIEYRRAWDLQKRLAAEVAAARLPETLLLLEHPPTYTLGRRAPESNLLVSRSELIARGIAVHDIDRGGGVTFHGPGQLVGYPVLDLAKRKLGAGSYLRALEETLIRSLSAYGVQAGRNHGYTGVWVRGEKIAAIGVKIDVKGVTQHGFAVNLSTDLTYFSHIVPCGIRDKAVTSLSKILGRPVMPADLIGPVTESFADVFGAAISEIGATDLSHLMERV
jgi:lipoyl(octanoyl) transferase